MCVWNLLEARLECEFVYTYTPKWKSSSQDKCTCTHCFALIQTYSPSSTVFGFFCKLIYQSSHQNTLYIYKIIQSLFVTALILKGVYVIEIQVCCEITWTLLFNKWYVRFVTIHLFVLINRGEIRNYIL